VRGDINYDGEPGELGVDITDLVYLVNYMFKQGPEPPCLDEVFVDGNPEINIGTLVYFVNFVFKEGPAPAPCPGF
jgi:hypothetical protein